MSKNLTEVKVAARGESIDGCDPDGEFVDMSSTAHNGDESSGRRHGMRLHISVVAMDIHAAVQARSERESADLLLRIAELEAANEKLRFSSEDRLKALIEENAVLQQKLYCSSPIPVQSTEEL